MEDPARITGPRENLLPLGGEAEPDRHERDADDEVPLAEVVEDPQAGEVVGEHVEGADPQQADHEAAEHAHHDAPAAAELNAEVEALSTKLGDRSVRRVQEEVATLVDPAGLTEKSGTAVQVTLDDAPMEARLNYDDNPNDLVVHQQDIQAVANAMWNAGAVAVTIQGQRLISTTGIKCEGNQVTLHGLPYSPPYVIVGIGDPAALESELITDPILATYRDYTTIPGGGVSWDMAALESAVAPAYEGLLDLTYATPIPE